MDLWRPDSEEIVFPSAFGLIRLIWIESGTGTKVVRIVLPGDRLAGTARFPLEFNRGIFR